MPVKAVARPAIVNGKLGTRTRMPVPKMVKIRPSNPESKLFLQVSGGRRREQSPISALRIVIVPVAITV